MPSSHSINRLFVFVDYANKLSPTIKSFMFASARSDCPDFLFEILIEEGQRIISIRPGQGFWVYGILGLFISGIWYFLVKIRV